jgi:hypothetical protein
MDELLFCACNSEDPRVERVSELLEQGAQPASHTNECVRSPRHTGIPPRIPSQPFIRDGWSCLIAAARWGHAGIVQLLLDKYAATEGALARFVNAVDGDRNTALMHASQRGHLPVMRLLLDAKSTHFAAVRVADVDTQNKCSATAPHPHHACRCIAPLKRVQGRLDRAHARDARGLRARRQHAR